MSKPSFLCIGGQRCGTTRLHRILSSHPDVSMTMSGVGEFNKEIHYFDRFVLEKPLRWYEKHFSDSRFSGEITRWREVAFTEITLSEKATPSFLIIHLHLLEL